MKKRTVTMTTREKKMPRTTAILHADVDVDDQDRYVQLHTSDDEENKMENLIVPTSELSFVRFESIGDSAQNALELIDRLSTAMLDEKYQI